MTHAKNCILSAQCSLADSAKCNARCPSFIACHGFNGAGGRVGATDVPADYSGVTLAKSPARTGQEAAYKLAESYAQTFTRQFGDAADSKRVKSLYLYSEAPGTGKTTMAAALIHEWVVRHYIGSIQRNGQPLERPAYFLDVNAWQTLFLGFTRPGIPQETAEKHAAEYYAMETRAKASPFVVLDDIGVRSASEAFRADLHSIVNHRVSNALPTVYTSNVMLADLAQVFDARLADRIREQCVEIAFVGESKRGLRKTA
ncbi:DNA replication protein [Paenibacillus graminis]|uniref:DNA replication protein n=1 Tax=Paenibacillus graminis TaxID=189425 RepID=UPI002DBF2DD6|nr:DNA replication protein [Paenibacillus graminis]MEC0167915.1 DNA replication protein [Paenibacillus graminis]